MGNQTKASKRAGDELDEPEPKKPRRSQRKVTGPVDGATSKKTRSTSTMEVSDISSNHEVIDLDDDVIVKKIFKAEKCFPRFDTGNVYIKLSEKRKYVYQLHGSVLSRASFWFERTLGNRPAEFDDITANMVPTKLKVSARYEMRYNDDFSMGYLVRTPLTGLKGQELVLPTPVPNSSSRTMPSTALISNMKPPSTLRTTKSLTNSWQLDGAGSDGGYEDPNIVIEAQANEIIKGNPIEASADSEPDPKCLNTTTIETTLKNNDGKEEDLKDEDVKDEDIRDTELKSIAATAATSELQDVLNAITNEMILRNNHVKEHDGEANEGKEEDAKTIDINDEDISDAELKPIAATFELQNDPNATTTKTISRNSDIKENNSKEEDVKKEGTKEENISDAEFKVIATLSAPESRAKSAPAEPPMKDQNVKGAEFKGVATVSEPQLPTGNPSVEPAVNGENVKESELTGITFCSERQVHGSSTPVEQVVKEANVKKAELKETTSACEPQPRARVPSVEPDANGESFKEAEPNDIASVLERQVHDSSTPVELAMEEQNVKVAEHKEVANPPPQQTQVNEGPERLGVEVEETIENELRSVELPKAVQPTQDVSLELMQMDEKEETQIEQGEQLALAADVEMMDLKPLEPIEDVIRAEMAARFRDEQSSHANKRSDVAEQTELVATTMEETAPNEELNSNPAIVTLPIKPIGPSEGLLEAYDNLFRIFYCKDPIIDTDDIQVALEQVELLIRIASFYKSLHAVRSYVNSCLYSFGRKLYQAIARDPPRWVQLSVLISSPTIFREGIIHIVGAYPNWPSTSTLREELDTTTVMLIEKKIDELKTLKYDIDRTLFLSSIVVDGKEVYLDRDNESTRNTWFVVQVWRDWYTRSISKAIHGADRKDCALAKMHRAIARGGDAYLPLDYVLEVLEAFRCTKQSNGDVDKQELADDLKTLKEFAQKTVKPLCVNNSMLDVDAAGIDYFTCTQVANHEMTQLEALGLDLA